MIERTLVILKPDCMQKNLAGTVMERFAKAGLSLIACKMMHLQESLLREHYDFLIDKPFFSNIVSYMMEYPVLILVLCGENAIAVARGLLGPTDSSTAPKGTIRGDFGQDKSRNVAHASDSQEAAAKEIARFFTTDEIFA
ncbi:MAG: nucleoside-diphosphate kinase [Puniceicoccales bacterium]|nr:nucleoside-diphosphate kinase [Puniceicoccales bacterium]